MFDSTIDVSTPEKLVAYVVDKGCADRLPGVDVDYAARVTAGVTHLDKELPTWWETDHVHPIDLDLLSIDDGSLCVSAQLSGKRRGDAFICGRNMLNLSSGQYLRFGFNAEDYEGMAGTLDIGAEEAEELEYDDDEAFSLLTTLWINVIRVRRGLPVDLTL